MAETETVAQNSNQGSAILDKIKAVWTKELLMM